MYKSAAKKLETVIYYTDYLGKWRSISRPPVVYFDMIPNGTSYNRKYLQCSDSVKLSKFGIKVLANTHYIVRIYRKTNNEIDYYKIFDFGGTDVTNKFINPEPVYPKRYLVFANGYRGPSQNWDPTDGLVTTTDRFGYWKELQIGERFINRLKATNKTYYIDGSDRIGTSNHKTMANFSLSASNIEAQYADDYFNPDREKYEYCKFLNTNPNVSGFKDRKEKGKLVGKVFLSATKTDPSRTNVKDTIDIVCHSMGYAYAIGFMEELKEKVVFGRMYIIAAENACSGGFSDWGQFEEVWQYGSNNIIDDDERDPYWRQDGIAPQCAVEGINNLPTGTTGGRAFISNTFVPQGFNESHYVKNYWWIFNLQPNQKGYVTPR